MKALNKGNQLKIVVRHRRPACCPAPLWSDGSDAGRDHAPQVLSCPFARCAPGKNPGKNPENIKSEALFRLFPLVSYRARAHRPCHALQRGWLSQSGFEEENHGNKRPRRIPVSASARGAAIFDAENETAKRPSNARVPASRSS